MHPEKHNAHVKAYYGRNQEKSLMQKAYKRFLSGDTKRFHKQTLIRFGKRRLRCLGLSDGHV